MLRMCIAGAKSSVKLLAKDSMISTPSTVLIFARQTNPQKSVLLHNKFTRFYTLKNGYLTDERRSFYTLSTNTITTTTYI